jgi:hypothetical protein
MAERRILQGCEARHLCFGGEGKCFPGGMVVVAVQEASSEHFQDCWTGVGGGDMVPIHFRVCWTSGERTNLICTGIQTVSDDTGLMLDCGRAEESRLCWTVLRNLRGKAEDVLFRSLQPFYSPGIPETVNRKRKKGNLK